MEIRMIEEFHRREKLAWNKRTRELRNDVRRLKVSVAYPYIRTI
jgi:hypothetical protein